MLERGMKTPQSTCANPSNAELIATLKRLAARERTATTELLRSLMEFDARRLYLGEGFPSLFAYCTQVLHYAEHAALNRIEVARTARRLPVLLQHIADGRLHLTGVRLLAPFVRSRCCSWTSSGGSSRRRQRRGTLASGTTPDATSQRQCVGKSGNVTAVSAPSSVHTADAPNVDSWSSTTSSHSQSAARRRPWRFRGKTQDRNPAGCRRGSERVQVASVPLRAASV